MAYGFYPTVTLLTRLSESSATLIDNILHFRNLRKPRTSFEFTLNNETLEVVENYKYLGLYLNEYMNFTIVQMYWQNRVLEPWAVLFLNLKLLLM